MKGSRHRGSVSLTKQHSTTTLNEQTSQKKKYINEYRSSTKYLAGVVGMFCCSQIFRIVTIFYDVWSIETRIKCAEMGLEPNYPYWLYVAGSLNHWMNVINSSGNFIIYAAVGSQSKFRKVFKRTFGYFCQNVNSPPVTIEMADVCI